MLKIVKAKTAIIGLMILIILAAGCSRQYSEQPDASEVGFDTNPLSQPVDKVNPETSAQTENTTASKSLPPAVIETQLPVTAPATPPVPKAVDGKDFPGTIIIGRPTAGAITLSLLAPLDVELYIEYGTRSGIYSSYTDVYKLQTNLPLELELIDLEKDTQYYYRICHRISSEIEFSQGKEGLFHTQRAPTSSFVFTIQADSHRDENASDEIYKNTMLNALGEKPDFHIDLGDTFMGDKWAKSYDELEGRYIEERDFFNMLCDSASLFLVNGNHEGENGWRLKGKADSLPVWATNCRKLYYPNPELGYFYSGSTREEPFVGIRQSYYAWEWGDALFVVLDPYWYTHSVKSPSAWDWTLGKEQYDWLKLTLEQSRSKFKFVFCHNLVGGFDIANAGNQRGGVEAASFYEWGGLNTDGSWGFDNNRPGWGKPIHQLLVNNNVTIFFHGHDHFYARQELDGVIYQGCPQPSALNDKNHADEYGYENGIFMDGSGHMRITVSEERVTVDYIRTYLSDNERANQQNGEVACSYTVPMRTSYTQSTLPVPQANNGGDFPGTIILGRPTADSITLNLLPPANLEFYVEYGRATGKYDSYTAISSLQKHEPAELTINNLEADAQYFYRVCHRASGETDFSAGTEFAFHTQRAPGITFSFGVQGDSHPERLGKMFDPDLYTLTMNNVKNYRPDFYFTMGDDFSIEDLIDKNQLSQEAVNQVYSSQRNFLGLVGRSSPLFLVNGNHEQAAKYLLDGTANNAAVLAGKARTQYYPLPAPGDFYSGDTEQVQNIGLLKDYYAWEWGDALFVVIDPYWHSSVPVDNIAGGGSKRSNMWDITLGDTQYKWFEQTLANSKAKYKFVFSHHVLGTGRGGIENAGLYEWGGKNQKGAWEFDKMRPGWDLPIQQLMAKYGVTIFFQGHDHLFAYQELDGVVYQTVPNPADPTYTAFNGDAYKSGYILPNSGFLNVTVSTNQVKVDYVSSYLPKDEDTTHKNGQIAYSYTLNR